MDYFWITQDKRYLHTPFVDGFNTMFRRSDFCAHLASKVPDKNVVFCNRKYDLDYLDLITTQFFLISKKIKKVFSVYEPNMSYKMFCVLNNIRNSYAIYYVPILPEIDALAPQSETNLDKSHIRKLVLKKDFLKDQAIFRLSNIRTDVVIVRLDVAESLLRRNLKGVLFSRAILE